MASYRSNSAGWRRLLRSRGAQDATNTAAERVAARGKANAHVATGAYRDGIHTEEDPTPNRARTIVTSDVPYAAFVEARDNTLLRSLGEGRQ